MIVVERANRKWTRIASFNPSRIPLNEIFYGSLRGPFCFPSLIGKLIGCGFIVCCCPSIDTFDSRDLIKSLGKFVEVSKLNTREK